MLNLKTDKVVLPRLVLGSTQTSDGIKALDAVETIVTAGARVSRAKGTAQGLVASDDVSEQIKTTIKGLVESRVGESKRALAEVEAFLVDAVEDGTNNGGRHGSTADQTRLAGNDNQAVIAKGRNIGVRAAVAVVDALGVAGDDAVGGGVRVVVGVMAEEVAMIN